MFFFPENLNFEIKRGFVRIKDVNRTFTSSTTVCVLDIDSLLHEVSRKSAL